MTSVDWQQDTLITCSDDKTLRVYTLKDGLFDLSNVLNTYLIKNWHTLTYMHLSDQGSRVVAVSENGYLFIWDLPDGTL